MSKGKEYHTFGSCKYKECLDETNGPTRILVNGEKVWHLNKSLKRTNAPHTLFHLMDGRNLKIG